MDSILPPPKWYVLASKMLHLTNQGRCHQRSVSSDRMPGPWTCTVNLVEYRSAAGHSTASWCQSESGFRGVATGKESSTDLAVKQRACGVVVGTTVEHLFVQSDKDQERCSRTRSDDSRSYQEQERTHRKWPKRCGDFVLDIFFPSFPPLGIQS